MILFRRPIRDPIPAPLGKFCPHPTWQETMENRAKALAKRHNREQEKWDEKTRSLKPLEIGDHVYIQNLTGNNPLRWEKTGVIVEIKQFHQYIVKVDGTGRVTLRNRRHLRRFTPLFEPPLKNFTHTLTYEQPQRTPHEADKKLHTEAKEDRFRKT